MQPRAGLPHRRQRQQDEILRRTLDAVGNISDDKTRTTATAAETSSRSVGTAAPLASDQTPTPQVSDQVIALHVAAGATAPEREYESATQGNSVELADVPSADEVCVLQAELRRVLGQRSYDRCFHNSARLQLCDNQLQVQVRSGFLLKWMQREFGEVLRQAVISVWQDRVKIDFRLMSAEQIAHAESAEAPSPVLSAVGTESSATTPVNSDQPAKSSSAATTVMTPSNGPSTEAMKPVANGRTRQRSLFDPPTGSSSFVADDRRFASLADYVANDANSLATSALEEVVTHPGEDYSPLYLHGGVGVGKTHLLEGLYQQLRQTHPGMRVLLMSAETFTNQYTAALRERSTASFRLRFRNVDAFLLDDFDFFNGKSGLAKEFLSTLKHLESQRKQVVLTADRHPRLIAGLEEEIVSRCLAGLVCRLESPDVAAREEILRRQARRMGLKVATSALKWIAQRFEHVREGQGAMNTLATVGRRQPAGKSISLNTARMELAELERDCTRVLTLKHIESVICQFFDLSPTDLRSSGRKRTLSQPRMLAMFLARKHTQSAYAEIGDYFGGRNHSTVISAERKVQDWLVDNGAVQVTKEAWTVEHVIASLEKQLRAG